MKCYSISSVADMTKKPAERKIPETKKKKSKKKKIETETKTNNDDNNKNNNLRDLSTKDEKSIQIANIIPVLEERFSVSKKTLTVLAKVEKRWINKTKKIEVPVSSEEVYINDKLMKSYEKDDDYEEDVSSEVNKQIVQSFEDIDNIQNKQDSILESNESKRELIPLFVDDIDKKNNDSNEKYNISNKETKKIIPILGEQVVVSKRIVQIGELVITKNKVIENKQIAIDTKSEEVTIRYPDGNIEML